MDSMCAGGAARGVPEEAISRMAMVSSGGGVDGLTSKVDEAVGVDEIAPGAGSAAEEGMPFKIFVVDSEEDGAEEILCETRTGAWQMTVAMRWSKRSGAAGAGVRTYGWKGSCGARVSLRDVA